MPETKTEHNLNFLSFLDSIGLIVPEKFKELEQKLSDDENCKLVFEISSYFHSLNASDWFDITTSLYSTWIEHSTPSKQPRPTQETPQTAETITSNTQAKYSEDLNSNAKVFQPLESYENTAESFPRTPPQKKRDIKNVQISPLTPDTFSLQQNDFIGLPISSKVEKLFFVANKMLLQSAFWHLKNQVERVKRVEILSISPSRSRFEKLYEDHLINRGNQQLRAQYYSLLETKDHTFSPKINSKKVSREGLDQNNNTPVFDRLSKVKPLPERLIALSKENREIEGATFSPRINRSSRDSIDDFQENQSPSALKERAAQRLYNNALEKERKLIAKRMGKEAVELNGCTFVPTTNTSTSVGSPSPSERNKMLRSGLDASIQRLHTDAIKRERELVAKQGEKESVKMAEHTFKPTINPQKSNQAGVNVHHRLYSEAKKRMEIHKDYEGQMIASDRSRDPSKKLKNTKKRLLQTRSEKNLGQLGLAKFPEISNLDFDSSPLNRNQNILEDLDQGLMSDRGYSSNPKTLSSGTVFPPNYPLTSRR